MDGLLDTYGLTRLTSLQQRAIPPILNRDNVFVQDVIVETQPGGGRVGFLAIPILEKVSFQYLPLLSDRAIRSN
jgi:superfamily II DNA/RNA helicase